MDYDLSTVCTMNHHKYRRIVAAATINFSLAGVRLLIEGGSYSRTAFIILEGYPCANPVVSCCDRLVFQDYFSIFRDIMIEIQQ